MKCTCASYWLEMTSAALCLRPWRVRAGKNAQCKVAKDLARARRDATAIPELIFWIESFEAYCLKLSKAAKCSVIKGMKRTVNRDFKIKIKGTA
jgi:uncharacterized protein YihD (DUF1040 family)